MRRGGRERRREQMSRQSRAGARVCAQPPCRVRACVRQNAACVAHGSGSGRKRAHGHVVESSVCCLIFSRLNIQTTTQPLQAETSLCGGAGRGGPGGVPNHPGRKAQSSDVIGRGVSLHLPIQRQGKAGKEAQPCPWRARERARCRQLACGGAKEAMALWLQFRNTAVWVA